MLEYKKEGCSNKHILLASSLFCSCGSPFADRYRYVPCHHVLCSGCFIANNTAECCSVCKGQSDNVELIHPNDNLYICTLTGCNKAFLNFQSLKFHGKIAHDLEATSLIEYYEQTGDHQIRFGDVQKITHEPIKEVLEVTADETYEDNDVQMTATDALTEKRTEKSMAEKPNESTITMQHADDLEELM
ncbi:uncharacterized protein BBOV_IV008650 [Babesia bovis T2Bo]|uniref:C2H2-type domain-containing protein n=1 Tax=Babesia bovis TaxID=5865 RepID=A7ARQ0_BABBO|nr:uncharacterized protein BBOV_IV008650 [Babesia bovis T2Bo]EDO07219.1 hypothetical protein BBOV_IV008650 [Babesia bovis T2Bo]|eukprot:XP_001610787.1 hypothetical protein [Babesia bovis T2Bo]